MSMMFPIPIEWLEELAALRSRQRTAYREKRDRLRKQQKERAKALQPQGVSGE